VLAGEVCSLTQKPYPLRLILKVVGYSSSAWYARPSGDLKQRPGPRPAIGDDQALELIRDEIRGSRFHSEGYLKIARKLARKGHRIAKHRVNGLMRENSLLSANRPVRGGRKRKHDGKIATDAPNLMWATDGKKFFAGKDGWCWFFGVIDHFNDEILSWHTAKKGDRFAAMEPVRKAVRQQFGSIDKGICSGLELKLRSDHGTQYDSADFMNEMNFLGLGTSKAYVRSPECNGIIERFHRTLNEQVFSVSSFSCLEEANGAIAAFIENYNHHWVLHRLKCHSPVEYRKKYATSAA
jgi:transposase InsO family protein